MSQPVDTPDAPDSRGTNLGNKMVRGSIWMIAMRLSSRLMGLASMVLVARLLVPADFGVFAVAMAAVALIDALTDIGTDLAIIRHPKPTRAHYDTAWTFGLLLNGAAALVTAAFSLFATQLYNDPRYAGVFLALALSILLNGAKNIGIADFRRDLQFGRDFKYNFIVQLVGVLVTLGMAVLLRSYWALVLGVVARSAVGLALSYGMHPFRPRWSLQARAEIASFSAWTMVRSLAIFMMAAGDRLVLGAYHEAAILGMFAVASSLAMMAVYELLNPIGRALLPGFAIKQGDLEWERRTLPMMFGGITTISMFMGLMTATLSEPIIALVYGPAFAGAAHLLALAALWAAVSGINQPTGQYLMVIGRVRELAVLFMLEGLASVLTAWALSHAGYDIETVLYAKIVIAALALSRGVYLFRSFPHLRWQDVVKACAKPVLAGAIASAVVHVVLQQVVLVSLLQLVVGVPLFTVCYVGVLWLFWQAGGRGPGIEAELAQRLAAKLADWRAARSREKAPS